MSVETAKEVNNDKTLKTKNDKERRLKEKQQNNTKKFMEERKTAKIREAKTQEKLKKKHEGQNNELTKEIQSVRNIFLSLIYANIKFTLNLTMLPLF